MKDIVLLLSVVSLLVTASQQASLDFSMLIKVEGFQESVYSYASQAHKDLWNILYTIDQADVQCSFIGAYRTATTQQLLQQTHQMRKKAVPSKMHKDAQVGGDCTVELAVDNFVKDHLNQNGLSKEQFLNYIADPQLFIAMDTNGDDQLSKAEIQASTRLAAKHIEDDDVALGGFSFQLDYDFQLDLNQLMEQMNAIDFSGSDWDDYSWSDFDWDSFAQEDDQSVDWNDWQDNIDWGAQLSANVDIHGN